MIEDNTSDIPTWLTSPTIEQAIQRAARDLLGVDEATRRHMLLQTPLPLRIRVQLEQIRMQHHATFAAEQMRPAAQNHSKDRLSLFQWLMSLWNGMHRFIGAGKANR